MKPAVLSAQLFLLRQTERRHTPMNVGFYAGRSRVQKKQKARGAKLRAL